MRMYKNITEKPLVVVNNASHHTQQYVDDSSNVVGTNSRSEMKQYTEQFMTLLESFYSANKLKINSEKTTFMLTKTEEKKRRLEINLTNGDVIKDDLAIKLLGWWTTPNGSMNHHIDKIRGKVFFELSKLKPFMNYMSQKERKEVIYSKALGITSYGLGLYMGQAEVIKDRLTAVYMRANRQIFNLPLPIKTKNEWVCKRIGVKTPRQLITEAGLKFINKVINSQMPPEIYKELEFPKRFRKFAKISTKTQPRTIKCRRSFIYIALKQFNALHSSLKYLHPKIFKMVIEKRKILEVPID